jgi:hypothetical protein
MCDVLWSEGTANGGKGNRSGCQLPLFDGDVEGDGAGVGVVGYDPHMSDEIEFDL